MATRAGGGGGGEATPSPKRSKLAWVEGKADVDVSTFLVRHRPSVTRSVAGGDGWIWVVSNRNSDARNGSGRGSSPGQSETKQINRVVERAAETLHALLERFDAIEGNHKIPKVKSRTSGPSKRMLRDTAAIETEKKLRECGALMTCGKWLFFERVDYVDRVFEKLAQSIVDGPLSKLKHANCHTVKVATANVAQQNGSSNSGGVGGGGRGKRGREPTQLILLYFDDVWNKDHAVEVLECIVKLHGEIPNSAKPDLYTYIGLDSNHPSKLRSTLYRPNELFNHDLLREWQGQYRSQMREKNKAAEQKQQERPEMSPDAKASARKVAKLDKLPALPEPVDPQVYWPSPDAKGPSGEKDGGFEDDGADRPTGLGPEQKGGGGGTQTRSSPALRMSDPSDRRESKQQFKRQPSRAGTGSADGHESSETETESEGDGKGESSTSTAATASFHVPQRLAPTPKGISYEEESSAPAASKSSVPTLPPPISQQPAAALRSTPIITPSRTCAGRKKRDRFGRDDF